MPHNASPLQTFHLTGHRSVEGLTDIGQLGLRPALYAAYGDISKLRHDFPVVLNFRGGGGSCAQPLTDVIDEILRELAPEGLDGERLRRNALSAETEIRAFVSASGSDSLGELWQRAEEALLAKIDNDDDRKLLSENLAVLGTRLSAADEVVGYGEQSSAKIITHAWHVVHDEKAKHFTALLNDLILGLSEILKVDAMKSASAFGAGALKSAVGASFESAFDFDRMSDVLAQSYVDGALPKQRQRRIESVLSNLKAQVFFPSSDGLGAKTRHHAGRSYIFDNCGAALKAFRESLPKMVELIRAMTIARLEIDGRYHDAIHDAFFRTFDERVLEADHLAMFPPYLVMLRTERAAKAEIADLIEALSSGLPIKVLAESGSAPEGLPSSGGLSALNAECAQLAAAALGMDDVFVLQGSGSQLGRMGDALLNGLIADGPALFSIYSGAADAAGGAITNRSGTPPYLRAAAASEARVHPSFVYDPSKGGDWRSRFALGDNPQPENDWPLHRIDFADEDMQRSFEDAPFTIVDFVADDARYSEYFARIPWDGNNETLVPVHAYLAADDPSVAGKIPYILMIDGANRLHRVIVEIRLMRAAERCRDAWRRLKELGEIGRSSAAVEPLLQSGDLAGPPPEQLAMSTVEDAAPPQATAPVDSPEEQGDDKAVAAAPSSGDAYIESPRCTSCDECTHINNRMFAYNDNKQAYVADARAGTYRQLVEAAESCQVAIIHPGKPLNSSESGLDDLLARAAPFL